MSQDLLGYQRTGRSLNGMASSEFAVITLAGGIVTLAQSLQADYTQQVRPAFVLGDNNIYWLAGYQEGSVQLSKLAGGRNFFEAFQAGNCGIVSAITLSLNGGRACAGSNPATGTLRFADGIIASLGVRMQAGQSEIVENATIRVATISNN
jgi:hypothetical protein